MIDHMIANLEEDIPFPVAQRAHAGTSMAPEERARSERAGYAATLTADLSMLRGYADTEEKLAVLEVEFARYRTGYRARYLAMLTAKSRCMSTMITGPSNFPTRRNSRNSDVADKRTNELVDFRVRALDAIRKTLQPELRPVMAGDRDAVQRLREKIDKAEALQVQMRDANLTIRTHAKAGPDAQVAALEALGFPASIARDLLTPDFAGRLGFPSYALTNNNANIRRMRARLATISENQEKPDAVADGAHARLEDSPADNRVRLFFPGKPDSDVRARLKHAGFRWTPSLGAWQAYRNDATIAIAKREAGGGL